MDKEVIAQIANCYGINFRAQLPTNKGYRNESHPLVTTGGQVVNIIIYKTEPDIVRTIRNANRTSNFLAAKGYPVRRTLDPRILQLKTNSWRKYAALYNYLPGRTIAWESYTMQHIKLLGGMLGNMHLDLKFIPINSYLPVADQYTRYLMTLRTYINNKGISGAIEQKLGLRIDETELDQTISMLKICHRLDNQQVLHLDFVRSNVLFTDLSHTGTKSELIISGVIDFEKTAYGHPLFDIARSLAFLLVDCKYKPEQKIRKYFLISGYQKRGNNHLPKVRLNDNTRSSDLLEKLIDVFLLYDFYKFLRHNPYEFLLANEHFIRTRDLLLTRKMIYPANDTIKLK